MAELRCCYIGCDKEVKFVIWNGEYPNYDNKWHSCIDHVGYLYDHTGEVNRFWPIEWGE